MKRDHSKHGSGTTTPLRVSAEDLRVYRGTARHRQARQEEELVRHYLAGNVDGIVPQGREWHRELRPTGGPTALDGEPRPAFALPYLWV